MTLPKTLIAILSAVVFIILATANLARADGMPPGPVVPNPVAAPSPAVQGPGPAAVSPVSASCPVPVGGTKTKDNPQTSVAPLVAVRAAGHPCFDRIVFEVAGPVPPGWHVEYVTQVRSEGKGDVLPLTGAAKLLIVIRSPANDQAGNGTLGQLPSVAGLATFRSLAFGGSFEGQTTFGLGVRAKLPVRVFTLAGPGMHSRVVVDVAAHF
jgi:hypothetical protein